MISIPPTATCSSCLAPTCGTPGAGQHSPQPRRVSWTPGFPWRPFAVPRLASSELVSWTTAAHTSAAAGYLMATGYAGGDHYVNQRAVVDGDLITAGPQSPVQFATLRRCGAWAWHRIASSRRTREFSTGPPRPLTQRSWTPKTQHECCPQGTPLFRRVKAGRSRRLRRKPAHLPRRSPGGRPTTAERLRLGSSSSCDTEHQ